MVESGYESSGGEEAHTHGADLKLHVAAQRLRLGTPNPALLRGIQRPAVFIQTKHLEESSKSLECLRRWRMTSFRKTWHRGGIRHCLPLWICFGFRICLGIGFMSRFFTLRLCTLGVVRTFRFCLSFFHVGTRRRRRSRWPSCSSTTQRTRTPCSS